MNFNHLKKAVHSIEMPDTMKNRIHKNCRTIGIKPPRKSQNKQWIAVAFSFSILLMMLVSPFIFSENSANFSITASAMSADGKETNQNLSDQKAVFDLTTDERADAISSVTGNDVNLIFTDIKLKVHGENIDTITYSINKGKFIEHTRLTNEAAADKEQLLLEKIYIIYQTDDADTWYGIKEIGDTYTVSANKQDQPSYSIAIPHNNQVTDEIIIQAVVHYQDGKSEQQDIIVTKEASSVSLKIK